MHPYDLSPERIAELQRMSPQEKLQIANQMFWDARRARGESIQREHQDWSKEQVEKELRKVMFAEAMRKTT